MKTGKGCGVLSWERLFMARAPEKGVFGLAFKPREGPRFNSAPLAVFFSL